MSPSNLISQIIFWRDIIFFCRSSYLNENPFTLEDGIFIETTFRGASAVSLLTQLTHWPLGDLNKVIFKLISVTDGWGIYSKIALRWMPLDLTDDKSILVQILAWCRQATSHYLSQCWPRFMSLYNKLRLSGNFISNENNIKNIFTENEHLGCIP